MNPTITPTELRAGLATIKAIADAIRELRQVPSGELYAQLQGHLTLDQYERIIGILKRAELVTEAGHLLTWQEPKEVVK